MQYVCQLQCISFKSKLVNMDLIIKGSIEGSDPYFSNISHINYAFQFSDIIKKELLDTEAVYKSTFL